ncbi:MAG: hypothetical protein OSJ83_04340 [Clostridia bacterium]|nr:hypothetical protein [Clostridia bacterium]
MAELDEKTENPVRDETDYRGILQARAAAIRSVRNDVFSTKWWQLALYFVFATVAAVGLLVPMFVHGVAGTVLTVVGVVGILVFFVYYFAMRTMAPTSFQQFTYCDGDASYRFIVYSKTRSAFSDGKNHIEAERGKGTRLDALIGAKYRYDFFADMTDIARTETPDGEMFVGTADCEGKRVKCKIVFDGETPLYGELDGARIKYFDVNTPKQKFIVPTELRTVVTALGVKFPKLGGLHVRDDMTNRTGDEKNKK